MFKWLKYLPLVGLFRDVSNRWEEETGKKRPPILQRSVLGAGVLVITGFIAIHYGYKVDPIDISVATDSITQIAISLAQLYAAALALYGVAMKIWKVIKAKGTQ